MKRVSYTAATITLRSRVHQASAHTCFDPSVSLHSKWQGLKISHPLILLIVNYRPEVLGGDDADSLTQITGDEFSPWKFLRHLGGTSALGPDRTICEHKSGPCPNKKTSFFKRGVLQFHQPCVSPFVRLPAVQTKVVTMSAPLNRYGFEFFFLFTVFRVIMV